MISEDHEDPYFRAVEEEFVRRRGAALLLSPRDWALIGEWKEAGVPLRVVLQGIGNVFDAFERRAPAGRRINSLSYCRQEVVSLNDLYHVLHAAEAGRPDPSADPAAAVGRHLNRLARQVRAAMIAASRTGRDALVGPLAGVAAEMKRLRVEVKEGRVDPRGLEDRLRRLDEEILSAARASMPRDDLKALEAEIDRDLGPAALRMTSEAGERTRKALLARRLRSWAVLPRLTLFD
jgi:hypothetical protein